MSNLSSTVRRFVVAGIVGLPTFGSAHFAQAQEALRVMKYTPADSGTPGGMITVTFSRPVAGMLGNSMDASKVMSLRPAARGLFEWRDPVTLRFIPAEPFAPGSRVTIVVDTAAAASNATRSATPYTFDVRFPGARPIAHLIDNEPFESRGIGPLPTFQVWYSAPVNLDSVARDSRLEFTGNCARVIKLRAVRQREVPQNERGRYSFAGQVDRDSAADRFRRIVDFVPEDSLPRYCNGVWIGDALDPQRPNQPWRYRITSFDEFKVESVRPCLFITAQRCEDPNGIRISFTVPTSLQTFARTVTISPQITQPEWTRTGNGRATDLSYPERLVPRTRYTVTIDTTIRDMFGRKLQGPNVFTVLAPDRPPGVQQQTGLVTMSRPGATRPVITVRTVNVDTLAMLVTRIPDSLNAELLSVDRWRRFEFLNRVEPQLQDTFSVRVPVHGVFNVEGNTQVSLPERFFTANTSSFSAIRFSVGARTYAPDSQRPPPDPRPTQRVGQQGTARAPLRYSMPDLGMVLQTSNLIAHAKVAADEGVAYVTDRSGAPVPNANVELYGVGIQPLSRAVTNAEGLAQLPVMRKREAVSPTARILRDHDLEAVRFLKITRGQDRVILPVISRIPLASSKQFDAGGFGMRGGSSSRVHGTITPDRDLYRPGDKVFAKLFVRIGIAGMSVAPAGDSARVMLKRNEYDRFTMQNGGFAVDTIGVWRTTLSKFGTASDSVQIPSAVRLGSYVLQGEVQTNGSWQIVSNASIRIDEFRPPEFLVALNGDSAVHYAGDVLSFMLDAKYLFGAPMPGVQVNWSVSSFAVQGPGFVIPRTTGFTFGVTNWWEPNGAGESIRHSAGGTTDIAGRINLVLPTQPGAITTPALLRVSAGVTDLSNQVVTATKMLRLQPSSLYLGAKFRGTSSTAVIGTPQVVDVIAVRESGERVANVPLTALIIARHYTRDSAALSPGGGWHWTADTVQRIELASSRDSAAIRFTPLSHGAYDVRVHARDELRRPAATSVGKWTSVQVANGSELNPLSLRVTTQQAASQTFSLGDTAHVSFDSPFTRADAWITYEREGVLEHKRVSASKGLNTVRVPVTARFAPNIWIGVTLIPRSNTPVVSADSLNDLIRVGYTELRVDATAHLLRVRVVPPSTHHAPGDSVAIQVRVHDISNPKREYGAASEVALWAVDQGVLSMTGFKTPDILNAIDQALGVGQFLRTSLTTLPWVNPLGIVFPGTNAGEAQNPEAMLAARASFSGGGSSGMPVSPVAMNQIQVTLRSDFRLTAFFVGTATTNSTGLVTIKAKLPDNITTFRLMASAIGTGNRYGSGEAELLVTR